MTDFYGPVNIKPFVLNTNSTYVNDGQRLLNQIKNYRLKMMEPLNKDHSREYHILKTLEKHSIKNIPLYEYVHDKDIAKQILDAGRYYKEGTKYQPQTNPDDAKLQKELEDKMISKKVSQGTGETEFIFNFAQSLGIPTTWEEQVFEKFEQINGVFGTDAQFNALTGVGGDVTMKLINEDVETLRPGLEGLKREYGELQHEVGENLEVIRAEQNEASDKFDAMKARKRLLKQQLKNESLDETTKQSLEAQLDDTKQQIEQLKNFIQAAVEEENVQHEKLILKETDIETHPINEHQQKIKELSDYKFRKRFGGVKTKDKEFVNEKDKQIMEYLFGNMTKYYSSEPDRLNAALPESYQQIASYFLDASTPIESKEKPKPGPIKKYGPAGAGPSGSPSFPSLTVSQISINNKQVEEQVNEEAEERRIRNVMMKKMKIPKASEIAASKAPSTSTTPALTSDDIIAKIEPNIKALSDELSKLPKSEDKLTKAKKVRLLSDIHDLKQSVRQQQIEKLIAIKSKESDPSKIGAIDVEIKKFKQEMARESDNFKETKRLEELPTKERLFEQMTKTIKSKGGYDVVSKSFPELYASGTKELKSKNNPMFTITSIVEFISKLESL